MSHRSNPDAAPLDVRAGGRHVVIHTGRDQRGDVSTAQDVLEQIRTEVLVEQARKLGLPPIESGAKQQVAVSN